MTALTFTQLMDRSAQAALEKQILQYILDMESLAWRYKNYAVQMALFQVARRRAMACDPLGIMMESLSIYAIEKARHYLVHPPDLPHPREYRAIPDVPAPDREAVSCFEIMEHLETFCDRLEKQGHHPMNMARALAHASLMAAPDDFRNYIIRDSEQALKEEEDRMDELAREQSLSPEKKTARKASRT